MTGQRIERDSLGPIEIAADSLIGINTVRGRGNFVLGSEPLGSHPGYVRRLLQVKQAAAAANTEIGALSPEIGDAIDRACRRLIEHLDRPGPDLPPATELFPIEMLEGSGGTSTNMNLNEVVANVALVELGRRPGDHGQLHPNDHVNLGQSTNDVIPTGLKLATRDLTLTATDEVEALASVLAAKAEEWSDVLRIGRTCLQPAQPMTLGQAFGGYAAGVARCRRELSTRADALLTVPLGGTAIGTGLGARPGYRAAVINHLGRITGLPVVAVDDYFDGEQHADVLARLSAEARTTADLLARIADDVVILSSALDGRPELLVPAVQAGSSLMPGKVNPVIPMAVQQVAMAVAGNDLAVARAARAGQLELNHFEPMMARALFDSLSLLAGVTERFRVACIEGMEPDRVRSRANLEASPAIATAFAETLGYAATSALVKRSEAEGVPLLELAVSEGLVAADELDSLLYRAAAEPDSEAGRARPASGPA